MGGKKPIPIDIRVIAATNQDLKRMVAEHTFRQDLYYRLNVIPMEMPPLRERGGDIIMLARHFLDLYNHKLHKNLQGFTRPAEEVLRAYPWPGNVRELRNIIEYLVNIADSVMIDVQDLPPHLIQGDGAAIKPGATLSEMVKNYERSVLEARLKTISGREERLQAARESGHQPGDSVPEDRRISTKQEGASFLTSCLFVMLRRAARFIPLLFREAALR